MKVSWGYAGTGEYQPLYPVRIVVNEGLGNNPTHRGLKQIYRLPDTQSIEQIMQVQGKGMH